MNNVIENTKQFREFFTLIRNKVKQAQYNALAAANKELIKLYWEIGKNIVERQEQEGWGKAVVELLAKELQLEFPGIKGFSASNLWRMRNFYQAYSHDTKLAQLVREIGWSHNLVILEKCEDNLEREYYIQMVRQSGWSRDTLVSAIKNQSYEKFLINQTNFENTVPKEKQGLSKNAVKDEYTFDFLDLADDYSERELELALVNNIRKFLTEMGHYFTFVGNQYRLEVDEEEYFIDLLLYHRQLRCLVAIELKRTKFKPEHAGKMGFYLSALDATVKLEDENPSIGIIICQEKLRTTVEYTLKEVNKPMGVATYSTTRVLPKNLKSLIPAPDEIIEHLKVFNNE